MTYINEMVDGKLYTINKDTGEVIYPEPIKLPQRRLSGKYVGLDTKHPSECGNNHQLTDAVKAIDPHWDHPVEFDSEWVMRTAGTLIALWKTSITPPLAYTRLGGC